MYSEKCASNLGPDLYKECDFLINKVKEARYLRMFECQKLNLGYYGQINTIVAASILTAQTTMAALNTSNMTIVAKTTMGTQNKSRTTFIINSYGRTFSI